jgi:hypothetical protein
MVIDKEFNIRDNLKGIELKYINKILSNDLFFKIKNEVNLLLDEAYKLGFVLYERDIVDDYFIYTIYDKIYRNYTKEIE